jgi:hypothetical protein
MIRRLLTLLLLAAIAVGLIAFAIANRATVNVALDPFSPTDPALSLAPPMYLLVFAVLIAGVIVGGCATWLRQGKWRARARRAEAEARALRTELAAQSGAPSAALPAVRPGSERQTERLRLIVPPPAA